jgi:hypothetical protein
MQYDFALCRIFLFTRPILLEVRETMTHLTGEVVTSVIGEYRKDAVTTPAE